MMLFLSPETPFVFEGGFVKGMLHAVSFKKLQNGLRMTSVNSIYKHMVDDVPTSLLLVLDQVFRGFSGKHDQGSACRFFWGGS